MTLTGDIARDVVGMYMRHPYPNYSAAERRNIMAAELSRYRYLGLEPYLENARLLDAGCGTGHRVMPLAQHFGVGEYVGLDLSRASLDVAADLAAELRFDRVGLGEGSVLSLPFPDASFDIVISQGVLHHTSDPLRGFRELVRVCRPGGFVNVYVYNKWNHLRHNLQKDRVSRLGGDDVDKRFEVAHRLYGTKPVADMTPHEIAGFYDQYCHPHKSDHTVGELLDWFDTSGLEYWGSYPPLGVRDFVGMAQFRGDLMQEYPYFHNRNTERIIRAASRLPRMGRTAPPFGRPSVMHRFVWQALYAVQGSRGRYSGGPSLCARKA